MKTIYDLDDALAPLVVELPSGRTRRWYDAAWIRAWLDTAAADRLMCHSLRGLRGRDRSADRPPVHVLLTCARSRLTRAERLATPSPFDAPRDREHPIGAQP